MSAIWENLGTLSWIAISLSGSEKPGGRIRTPLKMLKIAAVPPMPRASVRIAIAANPQLRQSIRNEG